ncbi:MAG: DEAD/DEAH box helicase, partial [Edaphobacter sp.]
VRREIWPDIRDEHELHDLLHSLVALPLHFISTDEARHWPNFYERLTQTHRAQTIDLNGIPCWVATERLSYAASLSAPSHNFVIPVPPNNSVISAPSHNSVVSGPPNDSVILSEEVHALANLEVEGPAVAVVVARSLVTKTAAVIEQATDTVTKLAALQQCVQGWSQILGPTTAKVFASQLNLNPAEILQSFLAMEMQGLLMRGAFEHPATQIDHEIEWCERRILQRIHRRTLSTLRKQIEPVTPAVYMRWLLGWQHLAPQTQLTGEEGVLEALNRLEGFEAPAIEWERTLLPARVANYDPRWLDALCLSGAVGWGRISPHPAWSQGDGVAPRRVIPTNAAPITFYIRETADWLPHALARQSVEEFKLAAALSPEALQLRTLLQQRGACFSNDIQRILNFTRPQTQQALWELATAGLAAADGFDQLRAMMDPRRKSTTAPTAGRRPTRTNAGRWSLLNEAATEPGTLGPPSGTWAEASPHSKEAQHQQATERAIAQARRTDAALDSFARQLLTRYGVLFRDLLARESNAPRWRDLLGILRRLEARGEIRGGRFITGFGGEQYALPEAVDSLRAARHRDCSAIIPVAAADPINLVGIVIPGDRVSAVPGKQVLYRNGTLYSEAEPNTTRTEPTLDQLPPTLISATIPSSRIIPSLGLFQ